MIAGPCPPPTSGWWPITLTIGAEELGLRWTARSTSSAPDGELAGAQVNPTTAPIGPGTQLGSRYRLQSSIGRGGVGHVWEANDPQLQRRVAVKTIAHDADDQLRHGPEPPV